MNRINITLFFNLVCPLWIVAQTSTVNYLPSSEDFPNPERGFYRYSETSASDYNSLDITTLLKHRELHYPPGANYSIFSTLIFRYFVLDEFKTSNISTTYLNNMQSDFNAARTAGVKVIVRFAYTIEVYNTNCPEGICPPYGDAEKNWILTHISQLTPVLQQNKDVIAVVQLGFFGIWGENYYTDYFGDASINGQGFLSQQNWSDRSAVLNALLNAVPAERMIQVRYPQMKQKYIYGGMASTDPLLSPPIFVEQAHTGTPISRIGHHNDCFLAGEDDFGTYYRYDSPVSSDTNNLKKYLAGDSKYTAAGGETCFDYDPYNDCHTAHPDAYGDIELERLHFSFLNAEYNNDVNNDWEKGGCMDAIKKRLGYRFVLQNGHYSNAARPGQSVEVEFSLLNQGFAAPFNPRGVEVILQSLSTGNRWYAQLPADPRFWLPDMPPQVIKSQICLPTDMPQEAYQLLLNLPDPEKSVYSRPEYSIRLANRLQDGTDVWDESTGYNKLGHIITVNNTAPASLCTSGQITFSPFSSLSLSDLASFTATVQKNAIQLDWRTDQEVNNKGFYVQRSASGMAFVNITWIDGHGNTNQPVYYTYTDATPVPDQINYYRLEQVHYDSTLTYSKIVSSSIGSLGTNHLDFTNGIKIFPQPATTSLKIEFNSTSTENIQLKISNSYGKICDELLVHSGINKYDLSHLPRGIYFFIFIGKGQISIKKVIAQ